MKKLLIVDDEKNIRLGLKTMIERELPDQYEIAVAANGQEALDLLSGGMAHIVITDIRMPVMDGIALLEQMALLRQAEEPVPDVIILSGHDDFEYAKSAIRLRVRDYLLKPIRRDELFAVLKRIEGEQEEQADRLRKQREERSGYREELRVGRLRELLLSGGADSGSVRAGGDGGPAPEQDGELLPAPFWTGVLTGYFADGTRMKVGELQQLADRALQLSGKPFSAVFPDWEGRLVLIAGEAELLTELGQSLDAQETPALLLGVGRPAQRPAELAARYKEARRALLYVFLNPQLRYLDHASIGQRTMFPMPADDLRRLLNLLGTGREKEIRTLLASIFQTDHLGTVDLAYLEMVAKAVNERVLDEVFRTYGEGSVEVLKLYRKVGEMYGSRSFHDYYRALEQLLVSVNDYILGVRSAHTEHADMEEALHFMETHYHRPLNMAMVSNHVSLNYSYFSEAFKAYTGENFVAYLKKLRIRHAKSLLEDKRRRLADVSEAVGFENSKQFARVFKELEGISPGEYRAKLYDSAAESPLPEED